MPTEREDQDDQPPDAAAFWVMEEALRAASGACDNAVYRWIEGEILSGRLAPGSKLDLSALSEATAATADDLRDAMIRLSNDGLVRLDAAGALRVSPVSVSDLRDLTATRIVIEGEALRRSIAQGDAAWLAQVSAAYARLAEIDPLLPCNRRDLIDQWEQCNHDFHAALVAACDLNWIKRFNAVLYKHHERYRRLSLSQRTAPRDVHGEHLALYRAVMARDAAAATKVIADHIGGTADALTSGICDGSWFGAPTLPSAAKL